MDFRLIYEGRLKASGNSAKHVKDKHAIRKQFHKQLSNLYDAHPYLVKLKKVSLIHNFTDYKGNFLPTYETSQVEEQAKRFARCGYRFVPLVNKAQSLICGLDILFLRRENPGDLILQGGDIDNRIKTLLDALRIPDDCNEIDGAPEESEDPFFCLLQNDSLVTELNVVTDRLLVPLKDGQHPNEVVLIIKVKVKGTIAHAAGLAFM
jgi:hypothetical protein